MRSDQVQNTRYNKGGVSNIIGSRIGWWDRIVFSKSPTDTILTLDSKYHKRPDKLAYDLYGKATYMWVILQYNNILDVTTEFVSGATITVPSKTRLTQELLSTSPRQSDILY